ncbi:MAG: hypothetical protein JEZ07_15050 [Phycisphaerae bacterium]|nr:hypothetical protein [Phycisphaerae bacterium]
MISNFSILNGGAMLSEYELSILVKQYIKAEEFVKAAKWLSNYDYIHKRLDKKSSDGDPRNILDEWDGLNGKIGFSKLMKKWHDFWKSNIFIFDKNKGYCLHNRVMLPLIWDTSKTSVLRKQLEQSTTFQNIDYCWPSLAIQRDIPKVTDEIYVDTKGERSFCIDYSMSHNVLAIGCECSLLLFDNKSNNIVFQESNLTRCNNIALSQNAEICVFAVEAESDKDKVFVVKRDENGKYEISLICDCSKVCHIDISPNSDMCAVVDRNGNVNIIDIKGNAIVNKVPIDYLKVKGTSSKFKVKFISNDEIIVAGTYNWKAAILDGLVDSIQSLDDGVSSKHFDNEYKEYLGSYLSENKFTNYQEQNNRGPVSVYNIPQSKNTFTLHDSIEDSIDFTDMALVINNERKKIIIASHNNLVMYEFPSFRKINTLLKNMSFIKSISVSNDGSLIAVSDTDCFVVIDIQTGDIVHEKHNLGGFHEIIFSEDNNKLIGLHEDLTVSIFSLKTNHENESNTCRKPPVNAIVSAESIITYSGCHDEIAFWHPKKSDPTDIYYLSCPKHIRHFIAMSADASKGLISSDAIYLFGDNSGKLDELVANTSSHDEIFTVMGVDYESKLAVTICLDKITLWDIVTKKELLSKTLQELNRFYSPYIEGDFFIIENISILSNKNTALFCIRGGIETSFYGFFLVDLKTFMPICKPIIFEEISAVIIKESGQSITMAARAKESDMFLLADLNTQKHETGNVNILLEHLDLMGHLINPKRKYSAWLFDRPDIYGPFMQITSSSVEYFWAGSGEFAIAKLIANVEKDTENNDIKYCMMEFKKQIWFSPNNVDWDYRHFIFEKVFSQYSLREISLWRGRKHPEWAKIKAYNEKQSQVSGH